MLAKRHAARMRIAGVRPRSLLGGRVVTHCFRPEARPIGNKVRLKAVTENRAAGSVSQYR